MSNPQDTDRRGRTPLATVAAAAVLFAAACSSEFQHTGNPPQGPRRELPGPQAGAPRDRGAAYDQYTAEQAARSPSGGTVEPGSVILGAAGTPTYHRPDCPSLEPVPAAERITYVSVYDAVNSRLRPCDRCRPGP